MNLAHANAKLVACSSILSMAMRSSTFVKGFSNLNKICTEFGKGARIEIGGGTLSENAVMELICDGFVGGVDIDVKKLVRSCSSSWFNAESSKVIYVGIDVGVEGGEIGNFCSTISGNGRECMSEEP